MVTELKKNSWLDNYRIGLPEYISPWSRVPHGRRGTNRFSTSMRRSELAVSRRAACRHADVQVDPQTGVSIADLHGEGEE